MNKAKGAASLKKPPSEKKPLFFLSSLAPPKKANFCPCLFGDLWGIGKMVSFLQTISTSITRFSCDAFFMSTWTQFFLSPSLKLHGGKYDSEMIRKCDPLIQQGGRSAGGGDDAINETVSPLGSMRPPRVSGGSSFQRKKKRKKSIFG